MSKIKIIILFCLIFLLFGNSANAIKIGLYTNANSVNIASSNEGLIVDFKTGKKIMITTPMKIYRLASTNNGFIISADKKDYRINSNSIVIRSTNSNGYIFTKKSWYRGEFIIHNNQSGLTLINDIDLESYLQGVVPSEMPAIWNSEALKAQAIAARSYAIANLGKRAKYGYDLKDTPEDQAYGGASRETIKTNKLVSDTRGQVLIYGNKVIPAYYHASSGGQTLPSSEVWGKDLPFVRPVVAYDFNTPKNGHGVGMSQHGANILAKYGYNAYQILGYFYQNVKLYTLGY